MKILFQKWLLLFVSIAFFVTFAASWGIHSSLAKNAALELLRVNLDDAKRRVETNEFNLKTIVTMSDATALVKSRAFARMIAENPAILNNPAKLAKIKQELDVDELHVSDEKGILVRSIPKSFEGYHMGGSDQSREFMKAIQDPDFALVQEPRPNGSLRILFQYAGVARIDSPGIVQIGYRPERIEEAMKLADVNTIVSTVRIGRNGTLHISDNTGEQEKIFKANVNGIRSLCLSIPYGKYILTASLPEDEMYLSRNSVLRILVIGNIILFAVIFILVSRLLQKVVIKGIYTVNDSLGEITNGNLNEKIEVTTTAEFKVLSNGINSTVAALKRSIENEAKRIDAELEMGRMIQTSILPVDFPDNDFFHVAAGMFTAREVGGDFYDFFMIDETHVALIIADVSGKGITAALFMMTAKTLLKELILSKKSPEEAFNLANQELCHNNQASMFLTAFLAVLDTQTNELICVNAGHNPPLLKHLHGSWEYLRLKHSMILGAFKEAVYTHVTVPLKPGDTLFLYTDGVTEAMNSQNELFGEGCLQGVLNDSNVTLAELIKKIRAEIVDYAGETPQSDDITMLVLEVCKKP